MERLIGVMLLPSMNPLLIVQITQSSVVVAEAVIVVMSTVANIQAAVLIILVVGDSRDGY
jgi:hypothetical protein